eukprot:SAG31_NODE_15150_length_767_cov_4.142216_2_plen_114_part_01
MGPGRGDLQAREGVRFGQHFNQALYCGGSRACVHTGTYMMNSRGVTNGVGVDRRWTTWPLEMRKLGYDPILVGYGDFGTDWRSLPPRDPVMQVSISHTISYYLILSHAISYYLM